MTEDELQEKLVRVLGTQRALIVIDDIWREGDWDRIKHVFLPNNGWKALLTSRNEGVALHANKQCVTFKPEYLTFEESWDLFQRIAFPKGDTTEFKVDEEMEEMGKQMIKHCGGLPLAVKVLGGLLAAQYTLREWERLYDNIRSYIVGGTGFNDRSISSVFHVLYLSFEELPIYLKHCFLYLAHFPEDYAVDVGKLSYYWAAEGIQRPMYYDGARIRDVADRYIEELVERNMVVSERSDRTLRYETCHLHDMMREVCLLKAEEENFVQTIDTSTANSRSPCKSRRNAVVGCSADTFKADREVKNPSLRSLLFIDIRSWKATSLLFTRLTLMRVLDISDVRFESRKVPSSIGKLIHLRYLSLSGAHVTHLPSSMRNLKQLLYLNLCIDTRFLLYMPNFLKEMRELKYLYLPWDLHKKVKMELGNLVNLETLENFSTKHGRLTDLQGMTRLIVLSVYIKGEDTLETLSSYLHEMKCLEKLTVEDYSNPTNHDKERFVLDCVHLRQLRLKIYMPRLHDEHQFPSHLTTIWLNQCYLEEDPMPVLEKLHQLKEVSLSVRSFCGRRIVCSAGGFPKLHKLSLRKLEELEEWIVEEGSMPLLHSLDIRYCDKLKEIPDGLRFITSLEDLSVGLKGEQWKKVLLEVHLPSLTTIHLSQCHLEEDPMRILEKLLHLKEISLGERSFSGKKIVCSGGSFPQLLKLHFYELNNWEKWIVEEGSMPLLHSVRIIFCRKFKEIPDRLRSITYPS